jgi:hypothetical protein
LEVHVASSLKRHKVAFGRAPELHGSDRGFFSAQNVASCAHDGVKVVCIPQRGGKKTPEREAYEKSADFREGQRFRAGIEGCISVLFHGRGMKRCLAKGNERFALRISAAVLANNLLKIAALLTDRSLRRRKPPDNIPQLLRLWRKDIRRTSLQPPRRPTEALWNRDENRVRTLGERRQMPSVWPNFIDELAPINTNVGVSRQKLD